MTEVQKSRRWGRILLIASLGVNVLVAGLFVGSAFKGHERGGPPGGMRVFIQALDKEDRVKLRAGMKDQKGLRKAARDNRLAILQALQAEPFDAQALGSAFNAQREFAEKFGSRSHTRLVEVISAMSDAERAVFIERVEARMKKGRKSR